MIRSPVLPDAMLLRWSRRRHLGVTSPSGASSPRWGRSGFVLWGVDVALLPVAGWGPRLPQGDHMNPSRAAEALKLLQPRIAIPIHWGT
jgi:L-ascorbate metabolism protein UlaG (beta-lactamase superfamily)